MPRLRVDFNWPFGNLLCLSHTDTCLDETGNTVVLLKGMKVTAFDEDADVRIGDRTERFPELRIRFGVPGFSSLSAVHAKV